MAKAAAGDLARWERKALRAVKDGRDPARFASLAIAAGQATFLRDALAKASGVDQVRAAFDLVKAGGSASLYRARSSRRSSAPSLRPGSSVRDDRWWSTWPSAAAPLRKVSPTPDTIPAAPLEATDVTPEVAA